MGLLLLLLVGCDLGGPTPELPEPAPDLVMEPAPVPHEPVPVAAEPTPVPKTPTQLYEGCLVRVEFPETDDECSRDKQCVATGCNSEICVAKAAMDDGVMSTCEERDCFSVLDACTCQEGHCRWTLKGG